MSNAENTVVENTTAQNTPAIDPIEAEVQKRLAEQETKLREEIRAKILSEKFEGEAKALAKGVKTVRDLFAAVEGKEPAFVTFLFSLPVRLGEAAEATAPATPKSNGKAASGVTESSVLSAIARYDDGRTVGQITKDVGDILKPLKVESDDVKPFLVKLLKAGKISSEGERRGTRYSLVRENKTAETPKEEASSTVSPEASASETPAPEAPAAGTPDPGPLADAEQRAAQAAAE